MPDDLLLVMSTWPDAETARRAVTTLVDEQLVACGNIIPQIESIYRWETRIETAAEVLVLMKTTASRYSSLEARMVGLHPYQVPEILAFQPHTGFGPYCSWVANSCSRAVSSEKGD